MFFFFLLFLSMWFLGNSIFTLKLSYSIFKGYAPVFKSLQLLQRVGSVALAE